jgi:oligopeptide transport system permease protein
VKVGAAAPDERLTDCFPIAPFPRFCGQYPIYMLKLMQGDLGESYRYQGEPVSDLIIERLKVSAPINAIVLVIIFGLGIPAGLFAALRQGSWVDPVVIALLLLPPSIPVLVSVPALLWLLSLKFHLVPSGWNGVLSPSIVIPVLALSLPGIAGVARLMRATTLEVLGEDYIRTARSKGLDEFSVVVHHVLKNALLPLVTIIGLSLLSLLEGSFFAETLLGIPGIGRLFVESITSRDYDVILAMTLLAAGSFIVANVVIDIVYTYLDPRIRLGGTEG